MKSLIFSLTLALLAGGASAQMVRQCTCAEIGPCKSQYINSVIPCADQCQKYAAAVGANYPALRQCLVAREGQIRNAMQCVEQKHSNACARGPGGMVPKRYPETLKIAAMSEINNMLSRAGLANELKGLLSTGKKLFSCMRKCVEKKAGSCGKRLGCGLALPSDSVMVQNAKQCAIASGFNTQGLQQICQCAVQAGIRQLTTVCPRIQIF